MSETLARTARTYRTTSILALLAGGLLVATPPLVEFVAGDFFLLLPIALLLMLAALPGLIGSRRSVRYPGWATLAAAGGMVVGLGSEVYEQSLSGEIPWLADALPPLGFVVGGIGFLGLASALRGLRH